MISPGMDRKTLQVAAWIALLTALVIGIIALGMGW